MLLTSGNISMVHFTLLNAIIYRLLTDPSKVSGHGLVFLLGQAMKLPDAEFTEGDPLIGLLVVVLLHLSMVDLAAFMSSEGSDFLRILAPFRCMIAFVVCGFAYFDSGSTNALSNSVVFAISFIELFFQFWLFTTLREEHSATYQEQVPDS
ncbi:increased loss of mitochondrial DNA protein 1 [Lipomyces oligophaga]|uniref:increased loss of mitochondrial DNA protein 1 n=1 Tax=Lipomyces oligophaga TaxID=45792 RepID=UPI0034CFD250